jgi:hypothetical protein
MGRLFNACYQGMHIFLDWNTRVYTICLFLSLSRMHTYMEHHPRVYQQGHAHIPPPPPPFRCTHQEHHPRVSQQSHAHAQPPPHTPAARPSTQPSSRCQAHSLKQAGDLGFPCAWGQAWEGSEGVCEGEGGGG